MYVTGGLCYEAGNHLMQTLSQVLDAEPKYFLLCDEAQTPKQPMATGLFVMER